MPNGADAPGKVLPSSWVPMKVFTGMVPGDTMLSVAALSGAALGTAAAVAYCAASGKVSEASSVHRPVKRVRPLRPVEPAGLPLVENRVMGGIPFSARALRLAPARAADGLRY